MNTSIIISSSTFLIGSILVSLGILVLICTSVLINNLLAKYWKTVKIVVWDHKDYEDQYPEEPTIDINPPQSKQQKS